jgi:hypothetical protein
VVEETVSVLAVVVASDTVPVAVRPSKVGLFTTERVDVPVRLFPAVTVIKPRLEVLTQLGATPTPFDRRTCPRVPAVPDGIKPPVNRIEPCTVSCCVGAVVLIPTLPPIPFKISGLVAMPFWTDCIQPYCNPAVFTPKAKRAADDVVVITKVPSSLDG